MVVPFVIVQSIEKMSVLRDSQIKIRGLGQGEGVKVATLPGLGREQAREMMGRGEQLSVETLPATLSGL